MGIAIEFAELINVLPYLVTIGVENVGTIFMNRYPFLSASITVAPNVTSLVDN